MKNDYRFKYLDLRLRMFPMSQRMLAYYFERDYVNPKTGVSPLVTIKELEKLNINYRTTNGGGWCRGDDRGYLGERYNVERVKGKYGRIVAVRTTGFKTQ